MRGNWGKWGQGWLTVSLRPKFAPPGGIFHLPMDVDKVDLLSDFVYIPTSEIGEGLGFSFLSLTSPTQIFLARLTGDSTSEGVTDDVTALE